MYDSDTTYTLWVNLDETYALSIFLYRGTNGSSPLIEQYIVEDVLDDSYSLMFLHWALFIILFTH